MAKRRCETVLGVAGAVLEGLAMLAVILLWIALQELGKAFEGAEGLGEILAAQELAYA